MIKKIKNVLILTFVLHVFFVGLLVFLFPAFEWRLKLIIGFELIIIFKTFKLFIDPDGLRLWKYRLRNPLKNFYEILKIIIYFITFIIGAYYTKEALEDPNDIILSFLLISAEYGLITTEKLIDFLEDRPKPREFDSTRYHDSAYYDPKTYSDSENQGFIQDWMITLNSLADQDGSQKPFGYFNPYIKRHGNWNDTEDFIPGSLLPTYLEKAGKEPTREEDPEYHYYKDQIEDLHRKDEEERIRKERQYRRRRNS